MDKDFVATDGKGGKTLYLNVFMVTKKADFLAANERINIE